MLYLASDDARHVTGADLRGQRIRDHLTPVPDSQVLLPKMLLAAKDENCKVATPIPL